MKLNYLTIYMSNNISINLLFEFNFYVINILKNNC